jgi:hypothetical protein
MEYNVDIQVIREWEEMIRSKFQSLKTASDANQYLEILQNAEGDINFRKKNIENEEGKKIANNALDLIDEHYQTVLNWLEQTPIVRSKN